MPPADRFEIDTDVRHSFTLPGSAYRDPAVFAKQRESVFAKSWHLAGHESELPSPGSVKPFTLLPGVLDVPLVLSRDAEGRIHAFSNVCTHRGAIVCDAPGTLNAFRCRYHGRRFALDGRFLSMPEFEGAEGFPSPSDDLPHVTLARFGGFLFVSLDAEVPF
ncbi:MAG TPA: Rieske (2Fe-2S) protein, partial [Thermoanaerobaculia bacterium]|nr:Rieske (2Fe-2S) protein [Thermoanaerobaculia bacterium]